MAEPLGIPLLDKVFRGGVPRPSFVGFCGDPGTGKLLFARQIARKGRELKQKTIIIATHTTPENLEKDFDIVFNCVTAYCSNSCVPCSLVGLNDIVVKLSRVMEENRGKYRLIVESINQFLLYNSPERMARFLDVLRSLTYRTDGITVIFGDEAYMKDYIHLLCPIFDTVIKLKRMKEKDRNVLEIERTNFETEEVEPYEYRTRDGKIVFGFTE